MHADERNPDDRAVPPGRADRGRDRRRHGRRGHRRPSCALSPTTEVVVPQAASADDGELPDGSISLPVIEQDGTSYVPVFTSEATMAAAAPDIEDAVSVNAAELGANWPSDDLWLAVNPGTEDGLTLPPDAVRSPPDATPRPTEPARPSLTRPGRSAERGRSGWWDGGSG